METNVNNTTEPHHDAKLPVVGSALSPQYCRDCKYYPDLKTLTFENHLKCKHCVFICNQQSNYEPQNPAFLQGAVIRSADGHSVDDDDMLK